jgi:hypothetical protein
MIRRYLSTIAAALLVGVFFSAKDASAGPNQWTPQTPYYCTNYYCVLHNEYGQPIGDPIGPCTLDGFGYYNSWDYVATYCAS